MPYTVEVCCYTMEDVQRAQRAGATRVELCADRAAGGTTPSYGLMERVIQTVPIDVAVMIRPRGGDAIYSKDEIAIMQRDIEVAGQLGADAVVFGILDEAAFLDVPAMRGLITIAKEHGLEVTCHRAFDRARDPHRFLQELIKLGVNRLLTSGQKPNGVQGIPLLRELVEIAGDELSIMPGGGIRGSNFRPLLELDIKEIHTGSVESLKSTVEPYQTDVFMGRPDHDDNVRLVINEADVATIVQAMKEKTKV